MNHTTFGALLSGSYIATEYSTFIIDSDSPGKSVQAESTPVTDPDEQVKIILTDSAPMQQKRKKRPTTNNICPVD